jgi:hypothetical protein
MQPLMLSLALGLAALIGLSLVVVNVRQLIGVQS